MSQPDPSVDGALQSLVECLEAEYQALLAEDHDRLDAVLRQKEILLSKLAGLPAIAGSASGGRPRTPAPWKRTLERVRALNRRNAVVLGPRALGNGARLRFLQSVLGRAALYAADGSVSGGPLHTTLPRSA